MPINVEEYQRLKKKSETAKSEVSRAEGAIENQMEKLKKEFNCQTVEEAEAMLVELEGKEKELSEEFERKLDEFKQKWGDRL